jgi:hypothetical protein
MNRRILGIVLVLASFVFLTAMIAPAEAPETAIDVDEEPAIDLPVDEEAQDLELEETEKEVIREDIVRIGEDIDVDEDELVTGDVVCIGGDLTIAGTVEGDAVCVGGTMTLDSTAVVKGDAVAVAGKLKSHESAKVKGQSVSVAIGPFAHGIPPLSAAKIIHSRPGTSSPFFLLLGLFIFALVIVVLLSAFLPGPTGRLETTTRRSFWKSFLIGLLGEVLIVPFFVLLIISIIGWALIPLAWIALVAAFLFGLTGFSLLLGNIFLARFRTTKAHIVGAAAMGALLVYVLWLVGGIIAFGVHALGVFVVMLGSLAIWVAWTTGLGAVILTRFGSRLPAELRQREPEAAG